MATTTCGSLSRVFRLLGATWVGIAGFAGSACGRTVGSTGDPSPPEIIIEGTRRLDAAEVARGLGPLAHSNVEASALAPALLDRLGQRLLEAGLLEAALYLERTPARIQLTVEEGTAAVWDSVRVAVRGGNADAILPLSLQGDFSVSRLERALGFWVTDWAEAGYPFAIATLESLSVREGLVRAGVRCDPGPQLVVSEISFPGASATRASFLAGWVRFRPDRLFRESRLRQERRRLEQSGLFLSVEAPELEPLAEGGLRVRYPVREGPHNRAEGALGYAGAAEVVSGYASLRLGNLFGTGRRLLFRWERAAAQQSLFDLSYHEPLLLGYPIGFDFGVSQEVQDSTYTLDRWEGALEVSVGVDFYVSVGLETRRAVLGIEPSEVVRRTSTVFGGRYEGVRSGWRGGRVRGTFRTGRSQIDPPGDLPRRRERLDRVESQGEFYSRPGPLVLRFAASAAGLAAPADALSSAEALWVGGTTSVRGTRERTFATRRFGALQVELGAPFLLDEGRAYVFFDAAWFRRLQDRAGVQDRTGWGLGMAARTGRQTLALDLGIPRSGGFSQSRIHLRLETVF